MRVLESLFKIYSLETDIQEDVTHVRATLAPHRESEVYQGHFPGHPITPGVMMIEGVIEVLEKATSKKLRLRSAKNIKYLAMMSPNEVEGCAIEATLTPEGAVYATYAKGETIYAKMKLSLRTEQ